MSTLRRRLADIEEQKAFSRLHRKSAPDSGPLARRTAFFRRVRILSRQPGGRASAATGVHSAGNKDNHHHSNYRRSFLLILVFPQMLTRKRVEGEVEYNDGEFAEIQTIGVEGIEKNLCLETIQIHRCDTENTPEEFQRRFPVGMRLGVMTTTEITVP
jgi:hypothetical protein